MKVKYLFIYYKKLRFFSGFVFYYYGFFGNFARNIFL